MSKLSPKQGDDFGWGTENEGVCSTDHILQNHTTDELWFYPSVYLGVPQSSGPDMCTISSLHLCLKTLGLYCMSVVMNQTRADCLWTIFVYIWIHVIFRFSPKKIPQLKQALSTTGYSLDLFHTRTTRKRFKNIFMRYDFMTISPTWIYVLWKNTKTEYTSYIMFDTIILLLLVKLSKVECKLCALWYFTFSRCLLCSVSSSGNAIAAPALSSHGFSIIKEEFQH